MRKGMRKILTMVYGHFGRLQQINKTARDDSSQRAFKPYANAIAKLLDRKRLKNNIKNSGKIYTANSQQKVKNLRTKILCNTIKK